LDSKVISEALKLVQDPMAIAIIIVLCVLIPTLPAIIRAVMDGSRLRNESNAKIDRENKRLQIELKAKNDKRLEKKRRNMK
jgi:hypothetical protein